MNYVWMFQKLLGINFVVIEDKFQKVFGYEYEVCFINDCGYFLVIIRNWFVFFCKMYRLK